MQVHEALLVEGTAKFAILCYGIFPANQLDSAFDFLRLGIEPADSHVHRLLGDGWPNGLILSEKVVAHQEEIPHAITKALTKAMAAGTCLASVCMYDGAFGEYDDIFTKDIAPQTYAFCFSERELVICLDSSVLDSKAWSLIIENARKRLST